MVVRAQDWTDPTKETPGGAKGTRTPDPLLAKQVLYQLSYSPKNPQVTRPVRDPSIHRIRPGARRQPTQSAIKVQAGLKVELELAF
jgi:hypothetical protein